MSLHPTGLAQWHFTSRTPDLAFDPKANMRAAVRMIRDRYGMKLTSGIYQPNEEKKMGVPTRSAITNPYRVSRSSEPEDSDNAHALGQMGRGPRNHQPTGPGLLGNDIDRMLRNHYRDGYAAAEREMDRALGEAIEARAKAWDEGRLAGQGDRVFSLATEVRARMLGIFAALEGAKAAPKTRRGEHVENIEREFREVHDWISTIMVSDDEHARRAAAEIGGSAYQVTVSD